MPSMILWAVALLVLAVALSVVITTRVLTSRMNKERELDKAYHEVLITNLKERSEYLELQVSQYRTPSMNGHGTI